jgi:hypothetical protein
VAGETGEGSRLIRQGAGGPDARSIVNERCVPEPTFGQAGAPSRGQPPER